MSSSSDDDFAAELEAEMTVEQEQENPIVAAPAVVIATQAPSTGRGAVSSLLKGGDGEGCEGGRSQGRRRGGGEAWGEATQNRDSRGGSERRGERWGRFSRLSSAPGVHV